MSQELQDYCQRVCMGKPAEARQIDPASVVTASWVRLKCQFGCEMHGKGYCCPPDTPTPAETRAVLDPYRRAILFHYQAVRDEKHSRIKVLNDFFEQLVDLEGEMFKEGFYKAFILLSGPCTRCSPCAKTTGDPCRLRSRARPSMEACGIDVYQTARNNGYSLEPLRHKGETQNIFCLMLVD